MKAEELMITTSDVMVGDWVRITIEGEKYPAVVNSIKLNTEEIGVSYLAAPGDWEDGEGYDEIEPIPLTEAILKANGFEFIEAEKLINVRRSMCHLSRMSGEYRYVDKTKKGFVIDFIGLGYSGLHKEWQVIQMFGKDMVIDAGKANYVHQLQHCLKICGIEKEITLKLEP